MKRSLLFILLVSLLVMSCACATGVTTTSATTKSAATTAAAATTATPSYFNKTGYPICTTPITLTVSGNQFTTKDWNGTILVAEIEKRLGIKLDCQPIATDAWPNQFTLMLSTNALPDIILNSGKTASEVFDYGSQGYFLAINDLIEPYMPAMLTYMTKYPVMRQSMTSPEGKIYSPISISEDYVSSASRDFMNKNWLANVGMKVPTTIDELYKVLVAFKEKDANGNGDPNDEIPMSMIFEDGGAGTFMESDLLTAFGIYSKSAEYLLEADASGKVQASDTTDNYKAYLKFMNKLYKEGLLDSQSFIQTGDQFSAKGTAGTVGYFSYWAPYVFGKHDMSYDNNFVWAGAYTSEWNKTQTYVRTQPANSAPRYLTNAKTKYPEAIARLYDYFYTDDGALAALAGYEGVSFDWADITIDGVSQKYKTYQMKKPDGYDTQEAYRVGKVVINGGFGTVGAGATYLYKALYEMPYDKLQTEAVISGPWGGWAALTMYGAVRNPKVTTVVTFPSLVYTAAESKQRATLYTDITSYLKTSKAQFITGATDIDAGWAAHLATLKQMGLNDLLAIEQTAYTRFMKAAK